MQKKVDPESRFAARRKKILAQIKDQAVIFPAAPELTSSRDQHVPFRQDSDFFYLSGLEEPDAVIVLLGVTRGPRSILYLKDRNIEMERWVGERLGIKRAKRRFSFDEVRPIEHFEQDLPQLVSGVRTLHHPLGVHTEIDRMICATLSSSVGPRLTIPDTLKDARLLTSQMRVIKDREELRTMRHACDITAEAFRMLIAKMHEIKSEKHGARILESNFARLGAHDVAFQTIFASGKNATVLHHTPQFSQLWQRELVLIDAGAKFKGYAADITRTVPASGVFSEVQARVYDAVLAGHRAALTAAGPGATLEQIHKEAVVAITRGLVELGILQGKVPQLVAARAYRPYYMHKTSHWLGLDTHDISPVYLEHHLMPADYRPLEPGMVFTIEPGLYFDAKDETVPAEFRGIGIRIEDDVVITASGNEVLTNRIPRERTEIESLMKR